MIVQDNAIPWNTVQYRAIPCSIMQYRSIPCNTMQYHAIPYNTLQCNAIPCNAMQYHASIITANGRYHCPVGSIMPFLAKKKATSYVFSKLKYLVWRYGRVNFWTNFKSAWDFVQLLDLVEKTSLAMACSLEREEHIELFGAPVERSWCLSLS